MAAVTQTATMPVSQDTNSHSDANSAPTMLKVGSPLENHAHNQLVNDHDSQTPAVYDILPEAALQLLCLNIERLGAYFAQNPSSTDVQNSSTLCTPEDHDLVLRSNEPAGSGEAIQMAILSKKFLSKKVPPIPLKEYLLRLHKYCPMSTAVYLAASVYISKMTLDENVLRVLPKNMHRLVLAGVWVAAKALEDLSYPHSRVAKVGGVSEQELSKLEISFCFLVDFELRVDAQMLMHEALRHQSTL